MPVSPILILSFCVAVSFVTLDSSSRTLTFNPCRFSQSALRKMYKILLGQAEPPDDVIPDFMKEELSGVGNAAQQAMERGRFLKVAKCYPHI